MLSAVIMAGGAGKRFWPLSRKSLPKQFLSIVGGESMIQRTVHRLLPSVPIERIYVVTARDQATLVREHIPELPAGNIILEPQGMNTAPAIGLSAAYITWRNGIHGSMLVLPSDHVIIDEEAFRDSIVEAALAADSGSIVTFGIKPDFPSTGFGYIEAGVKRPLGMDVVSFKEKPDEATAKRFCESGHYFWNSGMFLWRVDVILEAYKTYLPKAAALLESIAKQWDSEGLDADISALYGQMPRIPVDIGIVEKARDRIVIPVDYGWNDVGGWRALHELLPQDADANASTGPLEALASKGNLVRSDKLVALLGVDDLVVVDTPDALLIARMGMAERIKELVGEMEKKKMDEYL